MPKLPYRNPKEFAGALQYYLLRRDPLHLGIIIQPVDPWQNSRDVKLVDPNTGAEFVWSTSSAGGIRAVALLAQMVANVRSANPRAVPVVRLDVEKVPTKFGVKPWPVLTIIGWVGRGGEGENLPIEDSTNQSLCDQLDDSLPF